MTVIDRANARGVAIAEHAVLDARALLARTQTGHLVELLRIKLGFPMKVFERAAWPAIESHLEFVQLLPVCGSLRHDSPGGCIRLALETALRALDHRRGQILPRGAVPEVIGAHAHRWTYAVFVAALLRDSTQGITGMRVLMQMGGGPYQPWDPRAGAMCGANARSYRLEHVPRGEPSCVVDSSIAVRRFEQCVPQAVRSWLAEDAALLPELIAALSDATQSAPGDISALVRRATMGSEGRAIADPTSGLETATGGDAEAARGVGGSADRSAETAPDVPAPPGDTDPALARGFIDWLQDGIAGGTIPVNVPGALVHGVPEGMLLVSPRIFRAHIEQTIPAPSESGSIADGRAQAAKRVQRALLRAGWHLRAERGINLIAYETRRRKPPASRVTGVVLRDPKRFVEPVPEINRALVRVPDGGGDT